MPRRMASFTRILPRRKVPLSHRNLDMACHSHPTTTTHTIRTNIPRIPTANDQLSIHQNSKPYIHTNTNAVHDTITFHSHVQITYFRNHTIHRSFSVLSLLLDLNHLNNVLNTHDHDTTMLHGIPLPLDLHQPLSPSSIAYSTDERQVRCFHPLLIYTYVPHPENEKLEHYDAPFNKLHQLLRQFIVINTMPSKHQFISHHPTIYSQLRYLAEQYIPTILTASDTHDLTSVNINIHDILCYWHSIPRPELNHHQYPAYNLAEHHSLLITLPEQHLQQLQFIYDKTTTFYDLNNSPIRPVVKKPRYNA